MLYASGSSVPVLSWQLPILCIRTVPQGKNLSGENYVGSCWGLLSPRLVVGVVAVLIGKDRSRIASAVAAIAVVLLF